MFNNKQPARILARMCLIIKQRGRSKLISTPNNSSEVKNRPWRDAVNSRTHKKGRIDFTQFLPTA